MFPFHDDSVDGDNADDDHAKIIRGRPHRLVAMARWQSFGVGHFLLSLPTTDRSALSTASSSPPALSPLAPLSFSSILSSFGFSITFSILIYLCPTHY